MTIKAIYPPPAGRPRWSSEATMAAGLDYLSWGWREYGRHPIPLARHDGWTYQAVIAGTVRLRLENAETSIRTGTMVLVSPECAYGWSGRTTSRCKIVSWIWRDAPSLAGLETGGQGWSTISLSPTSLRALSQLHRETRSEATLGGDLAAQALGTIRARLDILLARARGLEPAESSRFRLARRWLADHPVNSDPCGRSPIISRSRLPPCRGYSKNTRRCPCGRPPSPFECSQPAKPCKTPFFPSRKSPFASVMPTPGIFTRAYKSFWGKAPSADRQGAQGDAAVRAETDFR